MSRGRGHGGLVVLGCWGIVSSASCAQLAGVDSLTKVRCVDSCDGGESAPLAKDDAGAGDAATDDVGLSEEAAVTGGETGTIGDADGSAEAADEDTSDAVTVVAEGVDAADAEGVDAAEAGAADAGVDAASDATAETAGPDAGVDASDGGSGDASDDSRVDSGADAPVVGPPSVPTGLTSTNVTSSSVTLSWNASTDPGSSVAHYNVYRNGTNVGTPSSTGFTDTGLSASTSYSYTVSAVNPSGNTSAQSTALSVTTALPACSFSVPNVSNAPACMCTGNPCYDNSWDGCFTIQNTAPFAMTNPVVTFHVPSNVTNITGTASSNVPPGFTETASLNTASSTITISYGGTLAAGTSIRVYYTTELQTEPAATNVAVTASNCH